MKQILVELFVFIAWKLARHTDVRVCLEMTLSDIQHWHDTDSTARD
jgi:hypothetical protein